jgi:hypothetical protein
VKWLLLIALICVAILPFAIQPVFANSVNISITAQGTDSGALPQKPQDFSAVKNSGHEIGLSWVKGAGADDTVIYGKWGSYPTVIGEGWLVYDSTGILTTDNQDIENSEDGLYYSAWSWNTSGYSVSYATSHVEGGETAVADAIIFIPMVMLCGVLSGLGFWKIRQLWPVLIIAALAWGALGFWSFSNVESSYDVWFFVGCIGILALLTHIVLGPWQWVMKDEKPVKEEDERITDRIKKRRWHKVNF